MILNGDVVFRFKRFLGRDEAGREPQEPDIVEEGGEFQIVQLACRRADRSSDQQRNRSSAAAMTSLPGECAIDFFADLPHKDAFDVTARCERESKAID